MTRTGRLPAVPGPNPLDCPHRPQCGVWNVRGGPSVRVCRMMTDHIRRALDMSAIKLQEIKESLARHPFQADYASPWWQDWYDRFVAELLRRGEFVDTYLYDASTQALIVDAQFLAADQPQPRDREVFKTINYRTLYREGSESDQKQLNDPNVIDVP